MMQTKSAFSVFLWGKTTNICQSHAVVTWLHIHVFEGTKDARSNYLFGLLHLFGDVLSVVGVRVINFLLVVIGDGFVHGPTWAPRALIATHCKRKSWLQQGEFLFSQTSWKAKEENNFLGICRAVAKDHCCLSSGHAHFFCVPPWRKTAHWEPSGLAVNNCFVM